MSTKQHGQTARKETTIKVKNQKPKESLSQFSVFSCSQLDSPALTQLRQVASVRLNSPLLLCSSRAVRAKDTAVRGVVVVSEDGAVMARIEDEDRSVV